jgi:protein-S-isoprenylcysteine O-methyltransferase Ste14
MTFLHDPFFWAFMSMFGLVAACTVVGSKKIGSNTFLGMCIVTVFDLGRFLLVLPFCPQFRFDIGGWHGLVGGIVCLIGFTFCLPAFLIRPFNSATGRTQLITTGFHGIVRNPIYLGEVLWCLGWAILFRSTIGVCLVPLWWAGLLFLIIIEEESLERELGQAYLEYKHRVQGRIIPGLSI